MAAVAIPQVHRTRVNGAFLPNYHGKPVCVLGTISKAEGGSAFQMKASDGTPLTVRMKTPITEPMEGLVEVYGIGQGKNLVLADGVTTFPEEISNSFDLVLYNEAVNLLQTIEGKEENPWNVEKT